MKKKEGEEAGFSFTLATHLFERVISPFFSFCM